MLPVIVRNDGQAVVAADPYAQGPFDVVLLSQNQLVQTLLEKRPSFDQFLQARNRESRRVASDLAAKIASMPPAPALVQQERTLRSEGAKTLKAAQTVVNFDRDTKILENMNKSPEQIIRGMVLDLLA